MPGYYIKKGEIARGCVSVTHCQNSSNSPDRFSVLHQTIDTTKYRVRTKCSRGHETTINSITNLAFPYFWLFGHAVPSDITQLLLSHLTLKRGLPQTTQGISNHQRFGSSSNFFQRATLPQRRQVKGDSTPPSRGPCEYSSRATQSSNKNPSMSLQRVPVGG
jgi:hypothetical protein